MISRQIRSSGSRERATFDGRSTHFAASICLAVSVTQETAVLCWPAARIRAWRCPNCAVDRSPSSKIVSSESGHLGRLRPRWPALESSACLTRFGCWFSCSSTDSSAGFRRSETRKEKEPWKAMKQRRTIVEFRGMSDHPMAPGQEARVGSLDVGWVPAHDRPAHSPKPQQSADPAATAPPSRNARHM